MSSYASEDWRRYVGSLRHHHHDRKIVVRNGKLESSGATLDYLFAGLFIYLPIEALETIVGLHADVLHQLEVVLAQKLSSCRPVRAMRNRYEKPFVRAVGPAVVAIHQAWNDERTKALRMQMAPHWHRYMSRSAGRVSARVGVAVAVGTATAGFFGLPLLAFGVALPAAATLAYGGVVHVIHNVSERAAHARMGVHGRHVSPFGRNGVPLVVSEHKSDPWWQLFERRLRALSPYRIEALERSMTDGAELSDVLRAKMRRILFETMRQSPDGSLHCCAGRTGDQVGPYRLGVVVHELVQQVRSAGQNDTADLIVDRLNGLVPAAAAVIKQLDAENRDHDHDHDCHAGHSTAPSGRRSFARFYWSRGRHSAPSQVVDLNVSTFQRFVAAATVLTTVLLVPSAAAPSRRSGGDDIPKTDQANSQERQTPASTTAIGHTSDDYLSAARHSTRGQRPQQASEAQHQATAAAEQAHLGRQIQLADHNTTSHRLMTTTDPTKVNEWRQSWLDATQAAITLNHPAVAQKQASVLHWSTNQGVSSMPVPEVGDRLEQVTNDWALGKVSDRQAIDSLEDLGRSIGLS